MPARIAVIRERRASETRVAATPETVRKLIGLGAAVSIETGAGAGCSIPDADYAAAGATLAASASEAIESADILLKVRGPIDAELAALKPGAVVVGLLDPYQQPALLDALATAGATAFAMEFVPRIS